MVSVDNKVYCLQYSKSFSGDVFKISDNKPFYTLKTALNKIFSHRVELPTLFIDH